MTAFKITDRHRKKFVKMYKAGVKTAVISLRFRCSLWAVKMARRRFGLRPRPSHYGKRKPRR